MQRVDLKRQLRFGLRRFIRVVSSSLSSRNFGDVHVSTQGWFRCGQSYRSWDVLFWLSSGSQILLGLKWFEVNLRTNIGIMALSVTVPTQYKAPESFFLDGVPLQLPPRLILLFEFKTLLPLCFSCLLRCLRD